MEGENVNTWFLSLLCSCAVYPTLALLIRCSCPRVAGILRMWCALCCRDSKVEAMALHSYRASGGFQWSMAAGFVL